MVAETCSIGGRGHTNDDGDKKQGEEDEEEEEEVMSMSIDEIDAAYCPGGEATRMTMVMSADEMVFAAHRYVEAQV